jgi:HlyD family secretion protein
MGSQFTRDVIMVVSDPDRMVATVDVDEADIIEIKMGDRAKVSIDALPDKKFEGQVIEIAGSATTAGSSLTSGITQEETVSFAVKVLLEGDTGMIRPGMSATADIITDTKENVFQTPIQCVTMRDPEILKKLQEKSAEKKPNAGEEDTLEGDFTKMKELLFVVRNNRVMPLWITTGISSDTNIEVQGQGIAEGMEIVCGDFKTLNRTLRPNDLLERSETPWAVSPTP